MSYICNLKRATLDIVLNILYTGSILMITQNAKVLLCVSGELLLFSKTVSVFRIKGRILHF